MAPFNNYCIVCDKLIVPIPNYKFNKLYCSESCQCMDKSILTNNIKNHKTHLSLSSNNNSNATVNDSIITSPLLIPILQDDGNKTQHDNVNSQNDEPHLIKTNNIFFNDLMIPNFNDHMAENNYKIWLNNM